MSRSAAGVVCALVLSLAPLRARAQVPDTAAARADTLVAPAGLPDRVADAAVDFFNDPRHARYRGPTTIEAGDTVTADVAVLEGPLVVRGRVEGRVVAIDADVRLLPGAFITGDLWVIGGRLDDADSTQVGGRLLLYPGRLEYRREGMRIARGGAGAGGGRADFLIATGKSYNRVEGLPITFGPRVQTSGTNPLRIQALAVYRTATGLSVDVDRMGYYVRAEQFVGGHRRLRAGVTAQSLIDPIEDWQLTDLESGLATFLLHRDGRDHYEHRGVGAFASWQRADMPLSLTLETLWERHSSRAAGSPWSLFDNGDPWRPQPLVAEGRVGTLALTATYDTRSESVDPATGWFVRAKVQQALSSHLEQPSSPPVGMLEGAAGTLAAGGPAIGRFATAMVDLRRYNRVDPSARLNFRLVAAAPLGGGPLPAQRQHALGGFGSLPGYSLLSRDCGARSSLVYQGTGPDAPRFFPRYGCDAIALLQTEYRGKFSFRFRWDSAPWRHDDDDDGDEGWRGGWGLSPEWTVFVDTGRGWAADAPDEPLAADVGAGILVDRLGVYFAVPLTGRGGVNLFVRLGPRF
jgi:hypothetical protein